MEDTWPNNLKLELRSVFEVDQGIPTHAVYEPFGVVMGISGGWALDLASTEVLPNPAYLELFE